MKRSISLAGFTPEQISNFCGVLNRNIKAVEKHFGSVLRIRDEQLVMDSSDTIPQTAIDTVAHILEQSRKTALSQQEVENLLNVSSRHALGELEKFTIKLRSMYITPQSELQCRYLERIAKKVVNFSIGPAGTGKTYLAVAMAVQALENEDVSRLILTRPAVEAGEKLGFLPGDLAQKVDPYLRPVYDALYEMLGFDKVEKLISRHVIEVAPLAYMRGRTLNHAFVILDEAQNTTPAQMKMFLTRIGFGSRAVVTGDITQTDLPDQKTSGLRHSLKILKDIQAIGFTHFTSEDVVRHPLVQTIVEAYDKFENGSND
ncbi:MAG TPA: PhoH family protein [Gammaproteobacteria bacterium]|nr:PhoH family protein [Gammaproteobacteria bacterium]